ncbi:MAG: hypothetical protein IKF36_06330 [Bacilli bacterium]|nr:hypothetical protein [Bacilli bacterium]
MSQKFDDVVNDIIGMLNTKTYNDKEKELIKTNIMLNLFQMTRSEETFEKGIQVLKLSNKEKMN